MRPKTFENEVYKISAGGIKNNITPEDFDEKDNWDIIRLSQKGFFAEAITIISEQARREVNALPDQAVKYPMQHVVGHKLERDGITQFQPHVDVIESLWDEMRMLDIHDVNPFYYYGEATIDLGDFMRNFFEDHYEEGDTGRQLLRGQLTDIVISRVAKKKFVEKMETIAQNMIFNNRQLSDSQMRLLEIIARANRYEAMLQEVEEEYNTSKFSEILEVFEEGLARNYSLNDLVLAYPLDCAEYIQDILTILRADVIDLSVLKSRVSNFFIAYRNFDLPEDEDIIRSFTFELLMKFGVIELVDKVQNIKYSNIITGRFAITELYNMRDAWKKKNLKKKK